MAIVGPHTFMPITAFSKKQTAVSHSSTESEMIALEEAVRTEGLPTLTFWEHVVSIFGDNTTAPATARPPRNSAFGIKASRETEQDRKKTAHQPRVPTGGIQTTIPTLEVFMADKLREYAQLLQRHNVPNAEELEQQAVEHVATMQLGTHAYDAVKHYFQRRELFPSVKLIVAEDNEAVIKILAKGRSAKLRHVQRTHRVNLDFLYDAFRYPELIARYVNTKHQTADITTKAINKGDLWSHLQSLLMIC